jgi:hypothetical protein
MLLRFILGLSVSLLAGCYSFSGTTLPSHLRKLVIHSVENQTLEPSLADQITRGLQDGFRSRSNLQQVNENGDAELYGALTQYSQSPQSTSGDKVATFRVDMLMRVVFVDRVKGDTLYRDDRVPGYGFYSPDNGETEATGRQRAVDNLVKVVLDNTVLAW